MSVSGRVLRQNLPGFAVVDTYYRQAPQEPIHDDGVLPITRSEAFGNTFRELVEAIIAKKIPRVVVVGHGSAQDGLLMAIMPGTKVSIGPAMPRLLELVDSLDNTGKPTKSTKLGDAVSDWGVASESDVLRLVKACWKVRWENGMAFQVHVRGCDIGAKRDHLRNLKKLFRSVAVTAPDAPMFYVTVRPRFPVPDFDKWDPGVLGRRFEYTTQAGAGVGPMILDCEYAGSKANSQAAVRKRSDIRPWAAHFHSNKGTPAADNFVVAGLYPWDANVYFLAHEPAYRDHLKAVTATAT